MLVFLFNCFIQAISHLTVLIVHFGLLVRCSLKWRIVLLSICLTWLRLMFATVVLASRLLESLKEIVRCELLTLGCHDHRLLHRLLLVKVLDLAESDALHAAGGSACGAAQDQCVILGISTRLWR